MEKTTSERQNVDLVHDRLRGAILRGEYAPGEELQQVPLAEELGVSRTPLREAFRLLQREGLLEASPNRSYRVTAFSAQDLEELYVTFLPLQALAVRLTIPRMGSEDIAIMHGDLAQMDHFASTHDVEAWERPHTDFHRRLVQHAGRRVVELLDQLNDHAGRYRRVYLEGTTYGFDAAAAEHRAILEACRAGETDVAAARLANHLAHTALDVLGMADAQYEPHGLKMALAVAEQPLRPD
jgi:DNA-binding GntR family transcriptional regulator